MFGLDAETVNTLALCVHDKQLITYTNQEEQRTLTFYDYKEDTLPTTWLVWNKIGFIEHPISNYAKRMNTLYSIISWIAPTATLIEQQKNIDPPEEGNKRRRQK